MGRYALEMEYEFRKFGKRKVLGFWETFAVLGNWISKCMYVGM